MYKKGRYARTLRYCLGPLADHTTYEAEATGVILALELLSKERGINTAVVLLDNQAVIQALSYVKPRPAQFLLNHAHELANRIAATSRRRKTKLKITWISGHDDVEGNERADAEAKKAAKGDSSQASKLPALLTADPLPRSITAARQCFRASLQNMWRMKWMASPRYMRMAAIDDTCRPRTSTRT
jgi:ribonuclease HI